MMGRLIDAEALKKALHNFFDGKVIDEPTYILRDVFCYIDNAPTVELETGVIKVNTDISPEEIAKAIKDLKKQKVVIEPDPLVFERPYGKWYKNGQSFINPNKFISYCCSNCHSDLDEHIRIAPNFCPNCGADMRGGKDGTA